MTDVHYQINSARFYTHDARKLGEITSKNICRISPKKCSMTNGKRMKTATS